VGRSDGVSSQALALDLASSRARAAVARAIEERAAREGPASAAPGVAARCLRGVTIARTHRDQAAGTWYALASLDAGTYRSAVAAAASAPAQGEGAR
jgi:hypothetical protein